MSYLATKTRVQKSRQRSGNINIISNIMAAWYEEQFMPCSVANADAKTYKCVRLICTINNKYRNYSISCYNSFGISASDLLK